MYALKTKKGGKYAIAYRVLSVNLDRYLRIICKNHSVLVNVTIKPLYYIL